VPGKRGSIAEVLRAGRTVVRRRRIRAVRSESPGTRHARFPHHERRRSVWVSFGLRGATWS